MKRKVFDWMALIGAVAVLYAFAVPNYRQGEPSVAGRLAPDFSFEMNGRQMHLSDFRGKVVVLDFWASWCQACVTEIPSLNTLQQRISLAGGLVIGISWDDDPAAYGAFVAKQHLGFPTFIDGSKKIAASYGTLQIPETYLITRDGHIARKIVGGQDWSTPELVSDVDILLGAN
jgi:cytochrome c biogenesis protein CcmG/thiol:disulfide interchange protein DsbE